jgi:hypothetical protein
MMAGWAWLTQGDSAYSWRFVARVILKAAVLFIVLNGLWALIQPLPLLGRLSVYNHLLPGRERLPFGETPESYNLSMTQLEAMLNSHVVSGAHDPDEYRIFIIGDSSVWGVLLPPQDTLSGQINALGLQLDDGRAVRAYNLGHPVLSLSKDLLLLDRALAYEPDLVIWVTTLQSFALERQLDAPLVRDNAAAMQALIQRYDLPLRITPDADDFWGRTFVGQRREVADWLRLQVYGVMWATTGLDQVYPEYTPRANDFEADTYWLTHEGPVLTADDLAFAVLQAGQERAGDTPLWLVNAPIFIADGENSALRYNFWYPRWAYDDYRALYAELAALHGWQLVDLWDSIDPVHFTDSPVHLDAAGSAQMAAQLAAQIPELAHSQSR